jgi:hypothetical protein
MTKRKVTHLFVAVGLVAAAPVAAVVPVRLLADAPAPQNDCEDRKADAATFDAIKSLFSVRPTDEVPAKPRTLDNGSPANGNVARRPSPMRPRTLRNGSPANGNVTERR